MSVPVRGVNVMTAGWDQLRTRLRGDLVRPSDPGYDFARQLQLALPSAVRLSAMT